MGRSLFGYDDDEDVLFFGDLDIRPIPEPTKEELILADIALNEFRAAGIDEDPIELVSKTSNYKTIVAHGANCDLDLLRFKFTPRAKWIMVYMSNEDTKVCFDDPRFAAQKNKRQAMWKAKIENPEDVIQYIPFAVRSFKSLAKSAGGFKFA